MPPLPGEERVETVFADVHSYFIAPTPRPLHHRFDKGSYFYVYQNLARHTARLEIANNPGTPEQDAFHGSLDGVYMRYSYKFPTLLTLVVDPADSTSPNPSTSPAKDPEEWRLASSDPRDQGQYKYRLHTLDIYFWTLEDAKGVIQMMKRILRPQQLDILDAPRTSTHSQNDMSPVVQQLENVAITDPAYRNGQTRNSQNKVTTLPPPPPSNVAMSGQSPSSLAGSTGRSASVKSTEASSNFAPMSYNPAAPAAPEPIAHREKTPPPADAGGGTGLAAAAYADHTQAYAGTHPQMYPGATGQQQPPSGQYASPPPPPPPPPQLATAHYGSPPPQSTYATPPPSNKPQHSPSVSSNTSPYRTSMTSPHAAPPSGIASPLGRQPSITQSGYGPPPQDPNAHFYGAPPGPTSPPSFAPPPHQDPNAHLYNSQQQQTHLQSAPLESPGAQIYGSAPHPHQPLPHLQPQYPDYLQSRPPPQPQQQQQQQQPQGQPPLGGYAQYSYGQQPTHHHDPNANPNHFSVHNQLYRPTEEEDRHHKQRQSLPFGHGSGGHAHTQGQGHGQGQTHTSKPSGRLEETAGKVDKKVGSFLKRLEKRL